MTLGGDPVEAVILPGLGARLHRLRVFGQNVLRTPPDLGAYAREPFFWGSYSMAPWCNRVAAAPTVVGGRTIAMQSNFPDGSSIHGQVYARAWEVVGEGSVRVRGGGDGWPWQYEVAQEVEVREESLSLELSLWNRSTDPMPAGLGIHPWFRAPVEVAIHAKRVYPSNVGSPREPEPVTGSLDRRRLADLPDDLDATWTDVDDPAVELAWLDLGIRATMRIRSPSVHVVAASPASLDAVAVEPQTHAPQGIRRLLNGEPGALALLAPGQRLQLGVELAFRRG